MDKKDIGETLSTVGSGTATGEVTYTLNPPLEGIGELEAKSYRCPVCHMPTINGAKHVNKLGKVCPNNVMERISTADSVARVRRYDRYAPQEMRPPVKTAEGYLRVDGRISRIGVQVYHDSGGGSHRELRLPEEVFSPEAVASFRLVPLTNNHPPQLLDAQTAKQYAVGAVGEDIKQDGDYLSAPLLLHDAEAIAHAEAGRVQLSCGYSCELEKVSGAWRGEQYDAIQRNIRGNHVALVDYARAGADARIRLDAGDACSSEYDMLKNVHNGDTMPQTIKIDGAHFNVAENEASHIQREIDRVVATAKERTAEVAAQVADLKTTQKALITRLAKTDAKLKAAKESFRKVKHERMLCPECLGTKEVESEDNDSGMAKCDYCDGKGTVSALSGFGGEEDPDLDEENEALDDATELEVEQATEEEAGKLAGKDGEKEKERVSKKAEENKKRSDSFQRSVRRRVKLEIKARECLGANADIAKLDNLDLKKAVLAKLQPDQKFDGKSVSYIAARFDMEMERLKAEPSAADAVRTLASPQLALKADAGRIDARTARDNMLKSMQDAWKSLKGAK